MHANTSSSRQNMFALAVCLFIILRAIQAEDVSTTNTTEAGNDTSLSTELTIQRKIEVLDDLSVKNSTLKDFKPSPQLSEEISYEYNRAPVIPVVGEGKSASNLNAGEGINARTFFWPLSDGANKQLASTTEVPWVRRVVFPQTTVETTRDQPYPFVTVNNKLPPLFGSFETRPSTRIPSTMSNYGVPDNPRVYGYNPSKWDQYGASVKNKGPVIMHKTQYESYGPPEPTSTSVSTVSPIKKIIGLLAAFIPLGLLISALTPSVIQVVPVNGTQSRSRADIQNVSTKKLVSSLNTLGKIEDNGCEERILCELLLSAGASKNAEEHVENLLQTFTEQERDTVQKAEELQRIYRAVKRQNCKLLACSDIEKNQKKKKKLKDKS